MDSENLEKPVQEETVNAKSFFARLGGVFFSPREAFTEIGNAPRLAIPLIAVLLISAFSGWYVAQKIDTQAVTRASLEQAVKQGRITEEQMNQQMAMAAAFTGGPFLAVVSGFSALLLCLVITGYGKLFSMAAGAENGFKSLFEVSLYATLVTSVVSIVLMIIILQIRGQGYMITDPGSIVASNLGSWIESVAGTDVLPKFIMRLAKAADIFIIWMIALMSIGFSAVSKKLKTSTAAIWLISAYAIFTIISAAISSVIGR